MDKINGKVLKGMLISGSNNLVNRKKEIDALNVFPVPDGDTGTNMSLTFTNGISEVEKSGSEQLTVVAKTLSRGLLMGARGNSGVILSQIFRGFNQAIAGREELTAQELSECMVNGSKLAYKAVMRPVEGTILTVVRESAEFAAKFVTENPECSVEDYLDILCKEGKASLDHTPELLPALKEARVVDSGGAGLLAIFDGFRAYILGSPIQGGVTEGAVAEDDKKSGYRTEFILALSDQGTHLYKEDRFRSSLAKMGQEITVIRDENELKVRITTVTPGDVLNLGQRYGEFKKLQIENMQDELKPSILEETKAVEEGPAEEKEYGIITVAAGEGLAKLFKEYRADVVISGGQTMNPSTEDFVEAIRKVNAKHVYLLPNNSNIIMAAQQAKLVTEDKDIIVLETKSIPQGLSACICFNPDASAEENTEMMQDAIDNVKTGQVTYSIKDTTVDGREIHKGDYMGLFGKEILLTTDSKVNAAIELLKGMLDEDSEIVTLIQGEDATEADVEEVVAFIEENYEVDVDVQNGQQPVYSFIIGVE